MADVDWVDDLKVVELRKRLKELGENTSGKKAVLVERLKSHLTKEQAPPAEAEPPVQEPEAAEMETDVAEVEVAEDTEKKAEKEEVKGGLDELLGDGKDDLEFDFEAEKPTRKKQKLGETSSKPESKPRVEKSTDAAPPEKAPISEDLVDFETPRGETDVDVRQRLDAVLGEVKEGVSEGQGQSVGRTASDAMEVETPVVAEEDRTRALRIQNFVRPFTEKAAKEMLAAFGTVEDMWMPPIKTHCYVLFENPVQAHEAYLGTYNVVWPRSGKHLLPQFVSVEDAKNAIEEGRSRGAYARASGSSSFQKARPAPFPPPNRQPVADAPPPRPPQKPALSLEDLFFKTQAKPPIYYLPLTDEQVAEKKRLEQEKSTQLPESKPENAKD